MKHSRNRGGILIQVIAFMVIGTVILSGLVNWTMMSVRLARHTETREQALQIAEAGIDYYRWHLAHAPTDYKDGTTTPGPYIHDYYDKDGVKIGQFALTINPPLVGSTIVTVTATGTVVSDPKVSRAIRTRLGKPSFAKYAVLSNSLIQFGGGTEIWGPVHSNSGIAFNGDRVHNLITSSVSSAGYDDPAHSGGNDHGVHTHTVSDSQPPAAMTSLPAIFMAGRQIAIPGPDFADITVDLGVMKTDAIAGGGYYGASGSGLGYHIVLKTTDVYDIYTVTALVAKPASCNVSMRYLTPTSADCTLMAVNSMWSISTQSILASNVPIPANGIIYVEDHVWVDGTINSARVTIAAALLGAPPASQKNIILNGNLRYTNTDGQDTIGLIAQNDIIIGFNSLSTQYVDAALIAQNGRLHRYHYNSNCGTAYQRTQIYFFGMFATNQRYALLTSAASCSQTSGYTNRDFSYDANLLYSPPPSFPLTTDQYQILSWDEV